MIVVDANVVLSAVTSRDGLETLPEGELIAPPLLWPEARSVLHVAVARGLLDPATGFDALQLLHSTRVRERSHRHLAREVWEIAENLGWTKTYDAEYLALARLAGAKLATLDTRMQRAAKRVAIELDERFG